MKHISSSKNIKIIDLAIYLIKLKNFDCIDSLLDILEKVCKRDSMKLATLVEIMKFVNKDTINQLDQLENINSLFYEIYINFKPQNRSRYAPRRKMHFYSLNHFNALGLLILNNCIENNECQNSINIVDKIISYINKYLLDSPEISILKDVQNSLYQLLIKQLENKDYESIISLSTILQSIKNSIPESNDYTKEICNILEKIPDPILKENNYEKITNLISLLEDKNLVFKMDENIIKQISLNLGKQKLLKKALLVLDNFEEWNSELKEIAFLIIEIYQSKNYVKIIKIIKSVAETTDNASDYLTVSLDYVLNNFKIKNQTRIFKLIIEINRNNENEIDCFYQDLMEESQESDYKTIKEEFKNKIAKKLNLLLIILEYLLGNEDYSVEIENHLNDILYTLQVNSFKEIDIITGYIEEIFNLDINIENYNYYAKKNGIKLCNSNLEIEDTSYREIAEKYDLSNKQSKELLILLEEIRALKIKLTTSKQLSDYIRNKKLAYKYPNISGIVRMKDGEEEWDFDGGFPKRIYAIICRELQLSNQGTTAKPVGFRSYRDLGKDIK